MRTIIVILLVLGLAAGGAAYYVTHSGGDSGVSFRTVKVKRDDLLPTISATGTVEPEEVVDVGAQVAGMIETLGPDPRGQGVWREEIEPRYTKKTIDYRSPVQVDTVLAVIDDSLYRAQRDSDKAALTRAQADLIQLKAKLKQATGDLERAKRLQEVQQSAESAATAARSLTGRPLKAISESDLALATANFEVAKANVSVGEAAIEQARAALDRSEKNLAYTVIKSPVDGVIIDRRVNMGQTVVASLNAPSLFLIAKDLSKMQVWASVNEADIGSIRKDMPVRFTVDAFPNEVFRGMVEEIRLNATMTQNVVTFTVVVTFENPDSKVMPYLTANAQFELSKRRGVLQVPNAALRWKPRPEQIAPDVRAAVLRSMAKGPGKGEGKGEGQGGGQGRGEAKSQARADTKGAAPGESPGERSAKKPAGEGPAAKPAAPRPQERGKLWLADGSFVRPVDVQIGPTDGTNTEVSGNDLKEDMEVVMGENRTNLGDDTTNPFVTKIFPGSKKM